MNEPWLTLCGWLLHSAVGGGLLLLATWLLMGWMRQPARRQRFGEWGMIAALVLALLSAGPAWLILKAPWPSDPVPNVTRTDLPPPTIVAEVTPAPVGMTGTVELDEVKAEAPISSSAYPKAAESPDSTPTDQPGTIAWLRDHAGMLVAAAYLTCAALLLGRLAAGYLVLWRLVRTAQPAAEPVARLFAEMASCRRVRLLMSPRVHVPMSCGLLRPLVILPASFCRSATTNELRWMRAHELTHLQRGDVWSGFLFALGQVVFFYLPWFWWLRRQVHLCQEYVADAVAGGQPEEAAEYAQFLLRFVSAPPVPTGAVGASGRCSALYQRISELLHTIGTVEKRCPVRWSLAVAGVFLVVAVIVSGIAIRRSAGPENEDVSGSPLATERDASHEVAQMPFRNLEGLVQRTDGDRLVVISIGSDAFLARGDTLELSCLDRAGRQSSYGGTVRILDVQEQTAIGEVEKRVAGQVRVGDQVRGLNNSLCFRFKDPRFTTIKSADKSDRSVLYFWYQVINRGPHPGTFRPNCELVTTEGQQTHREVLMPLDVQEKIQKIEDPTRYFDLRDSVTISQKPIPPGKPDGPESYACGIATWPGLPAEIKSFTIHVAGLAGVRKQALQLEFKQQGDRFVLVAPHKFVEREVVRIPEQERDQHLREIARMEFEREVQRVNEAARNARQTVEREIERQQEEELNWFRRRRAEEDDRMRLAVDEAIKNARSVSVLDPGRARELLQKSLDGVRSHPDISDRTRVELEAQLASALRAERRTALKSVSKSEPEALRLRRKANELRMRLESLVDFDGIKKPTELKDALKSIEEQYGAPVVINEKVLNPVLKALPRRAGKPLPDTVGRCIIADRVNPIPEMQKVTLGTVLNKILSRLPIDATWALRMDSVEITTISALREEIRRREETRRRMQVLFDFGGLRQPTKLQDALNSLEKQYEVHFRINESEFAGALKALPRRPDNPLPDTVGSCVIADQTNPIPEMPKVTLETVLDKMLWRLPVKATWVVKDGSVEITTR